VNNISESHPRKKARGHTRVSKACSNCRKQKTRCLHSDDSNSCLRCLSMKLECSLDTEHQQSYNTHSQLLPSLGHNHLTSNSIHDRLTPQPQPQHPYSPGNGHNGSVSRSHSLTNPSMHAHTLPQSHPPPSMPVSAPLRPAESMPTFFPYGSTVPSPRFNYLGYSQHPSQHPNSYQRDAAESETLDEINNTVKTILSFITSNNSKNDGNKAKPIDLAEMDMTLNMQSISSPANQVSSLPISTDPINVTNIPTQFNSLSPINYLNSLSEMQGQINGGGELNHTLPLSIQQQLYPLHLFKPPFEDIIDSKIITLEQAEQLVNVFRDRYGRWLSFPSLKSTKRLIKRLRLKCPLLLTISCLLSLKYGDPLLKQSIWKRMATIANREIHWLNSSYSCGLEELQCLVILGAYCIGMSDSSIDDRPTEEEPLLLLDGWNISGIGLTVFEKINSYGLLDQMYGSNVESLWGNNKKSIEKKLGLDKFNRARRFNRTENTDEDEVGEEEEGDSEDDEEDTNEFNILTLHRIWNTLVLIQLAYCLLYGRRSWISIEKLKPRDVSHISSATNFDFRIIAEIHIYLIGYRYLIHNERFDDAVKGMKFWLDKWGSSFGQPSNQFVEIDYHFIEMLIKLKQSKLDLNSICLEFHLHNSQSKSTTSMCTDSSLNGNGANQFDFSSLKLNLNDLENLRMHSVSIVNSITTVTDDSYFAFLSDQIHLTIFFATNALISVLTILNTLKKNAHTIDFTATNMDRSVMTNFHMDKALLKKVQSLIFRYRTVATNTNDTFFKYYSILENNYSSNLVSSL
jgi:hypothetical protein